MSDSSRTQGLQPTRLLRPWDFPGKSTGVGCLCLLQHLTPKPMFFPHSSRLSSSFPHSLKGALRLEVGRGRMQPPHSHLAQNLQGETTHPAGLPSFLSRKGQLSLPHRKLFSGTNSARVLITTNHLPSTHGKGQSRLPPCPSHTKWPFS